MVNILSKLYVDSGEYARSGIHVWAFASVSEAAAAAAIRSLTDVYDSTHSVQWTCRRTIQIELSRARVGPLPTTDAAAAAAAVWRRSAYSQLNLCATTGPFALMPNYEWIAIRDSRARLTNARARARANIHRTSIANFPASTQRHYVVGSLCTHAHSRLSDFDSRDTLNYYRFSYLFASLVNITRSKTDGTTPRSGVGSGRQEGEGGMTCCTFHLFSLFFGFVLFRAASRSFCKLA